MRQHLSFREYFRRGNARLYMSFRRTETPTVAAAKAGFSAATAYRIESSQAILIFRFQRRAELAKPGSLVTLRWRRESRANPSLKNEVPVACK